jgi:hypothetical protein
MAPALASFSSGRVIQPVRNMLTIEEGKRFLGVMPAVAETGMGAKLVCFFPKNAGTGKLTLRQPRVQQSLRKKRTGQNRNLTQASQRIFLFVNNLQLESRGNSVCACFVLRTCRAEGGPTS